MNISNCELYHQQIAVTFTDHSYAHNVNIFNLMTYKLYHYSEDTKFHVEFRIRVALGVLMKPMYILYSGTLKFVNPFECSLFLLSEI